MVRTKVMIGAAIAALGLVAISANAANSAGHAAPGSAVSLIAGTATLQKARDSDDAAIAVRRTSTAPSQEASEHPNAPEPAKALAKRSPACQQAIEALKTLHRADVAEDKAERASHQPPTLNSRQADRAEDLAEAQKWHDALVAARNACRPQRSAACQTAITNLTSLIEANRLQLLRDFENGLIPQGLKTLSDLRAAFRAAAMTCGFRE